MVPDKTDYFWYSNYFMYYYISIMQISYQFLNRKSVQCPDYAHI